MVGQTELRKLCGMLHSVGCERSHQEIAEALLETKNWHHGGDLGEDPKSFADFRASALIKGEMPLIHLVNATNRLRT